MDDWIDRLAEAMSTTPLSTFFVGLAVGSKTAAGTDRPTALADALSTLREILPEAPGEPG